MPRGQKQLARGSSDPVRFDPTADLPAVPGSQGRGRDVADLDPQFASVRRRKLRCADELIVGTDQLMSVPGYPYGIGQVVSVTQGRDKTKRSIKLFYDPDLHGMIDIEIDACHKLEVFDPQATDARA